MPVEETKILDKFGRELKEGDICFRIKTVSNANRSRTFVFPVRVDYFTKYKVKVEGVYVDSKNLILASSNGLVFNATAYR